MDQGKEGLQEDSEDLKVLVDIRFCPIPSFNRLGMAEVLLINMSPDARRQLGYITAALLVLNTPVTTLRGKDVSVDT